MQAFGRESALAIMEEISATQPSTSLSVINNSSIAYKDKNRPLTGKKIILDLESATHRDMLQVFPFIFFCHSTFVPVHFPVIFHHPSVRI